MSLIRHKAIAAAWATWHERHGGKLGPGPAFAEAISAALDVELAEIEKHVKERNAFGSTNRFKPTHIHKTRGTKYRVIGEATAQISSHDVTVDGHRARVLRDHERVVVYQSEDGKLWVRFPDEFNDGRFEKTLQHITIGTAFNMGTEEK